jgi:hypothetical protein
MKKQIALGILIVAVLVLAACGSSPSSSSSQNVNDIFRYKKSNVSLTVPFTCTRIQAYEWLSLWASEKFNPVFSHKDDRYTNMGGQERGKIVDYQTPFWSWSWDYYFEIKVDSYLATLTLTDLDFAATRIDFSSQKSFNDFVDSYIKEIFDDFQLYLQSK